MNVFVTGGAGYIGSVCVEELLNAGHTVTVFDNLSEGHRAAVDPRAAFVQGDLADPPGIARALKESGAAAVIHFAANALVGESMANPGKYFRNNVAGGVNLLDAALAAGVRKFVFSSTCATYGSPERVPITEDLPQRPINPYGESKLMFEKMLGWYHQAHGLEFVAFRYFNAAGASARFGEHHHKPRSARFTAPIIRRRTARASAITSTSSIWPPRTSLPWLPARKAATTLATAMAPRCAR